MFSTIVGGGGGGGKHETHSNKKSVLPWPDLHGNATLLGQQQGNIKWFLIGLVNLFSKQVVADLIVKGTTPRTFGLKKEKKEKSWHEFLMFSVQNLPTDAAIYGMRNTSLQFIVLHTLL